MHISKQNNTICHRHYIFTGYITQTIYKGVYQTDFKKLFLEENVGGFDLLFRTVFGVIAIIALATGFVKTSP
jgi:hypothetical protein